MLYEMRGGAFQVRMTSPIASRTAASARNASSRSVLGQTPAAPVRCVTNPSPAEHSGPDAQQAIGWSAYRPGGVMVPVAVFTHNPASAAHAR